MKKLFLFMISAALLTQSTFAAETTNSVGYKVVRDQIATADPDPNSVERTYAYYAAHLKGTAYLPRHNDLIKITYANYIEFVFTFNDAAASAVVTIYAFRDPDGILCPLEPVCSYAVFAGSQQTGQTPARYFADQATLVSNPWPVSLFDYEGQGGVFKINLDAKGYRGFVVLLTTISSGDNVSGYGVYY